MTHIDISEFSGKRVVVTAGTKGAGGATFRRFMAGGARAITAARFERPDFVPVDCLVPADLSTAKA